MDKIFTLSISHFLYLEENERLDLIDGKEIEVLGINVPVWFYKGNTSEPAEEIFCLYNLTNNLEDYPVSKTLKGYKINIPQDLLSEFDYNNILNTIDEVWHRNTLENKLSIIKKYKNKVFTNKEEGLKKLFFKRFIKNINRDKVINTIHTVDIIPINVLKESLK